MLLLGKVDDNKDDKPSQHNSVGIIISISVLRVSSSKSAHMIHERVLYLIPAYAGSYPKQCVGRWSIFE